MYQFDDLRNLLAHSNLYYLICMGLDGTYQYTNDHYTQAFGRHAGDIIGKPFEVTMHPEDAPAAKATAMNCIQHPEQLFTLLLRKHDGTGGFIITQWECQSLLDDTGHIRGVFCLGCNLSSQLDHITPASATLSLKESLLQQPSHVTRKPLANIMGLVAVMQQTDDAKQLRSLCTMIQDSARELDAVMKQLYHSPEA